MCTSAPPKQNRVSWLAVQGMMILDKCYQYIPANVQPSEGSIFPLSLQHIFVQGHWHGIFEKLHPSSWSSLIQSYAYVDKVVCHRDIENNSASDSASMSGMQLYLHY